MDNQTSQTQTSQDILKYLGHASLRITTREGKIIFVDPYAGNDQDYEPAADLILITHDHYDHNEISKIKHRDNATVITWQEALAGGEHRAFDLGYIKVESAEAGYNKYHDETKCVGYILVFSSGITVYIPGDTYLTPQMDTLAGRNIDYAFFPMDGTYTMTPEEAVIAANKVQAKHSIPYHTDPKSDELNQAIVERFNVDNKLILNKGDELILK